MNLLTDIETQMRIFQPTHSIRPTTSLVVTVFIKIHAITSMSLPLFHHRPRCPKRPLHSPRQRWRSLTISLTTFFALTWKLAKLNHPIITTNPWWIRNSGGDSRNLTIALVIIIRNTVTKGRTWSSTSTTMSHQGTIRIYESISRPRAQYAIRRKRAQPSSISAIRAQITLSLMRAPRRCIKRFRTRQVRVAYPRVILLLIMAMHLRPCCRTMSCSSTRCTTTTRLPSQNL